MNSSDKHVDDQTWTLIDVVVSRTESDVIADFLWSHGVAAVEVLQHKDENYEVLRTSVGERPEALIATLRQRFPDVTASILHFDKSISDTWRQFATPTWVTDTVVIVPEWIDSPQAEHVLRIEPLDTFGLGNHPTTILTFRLGLQYIAPQSTVFDLGSGSGVLAVGFAKFLGCTTLAYDIALGAPQALRVNAQLNNVNSCTWSDGYPTQKVDVVLANILAPVLIQEAEAIQNCLVENGLVILSGMREEQSESVQQNFRRCDLIDREELDGWVGLVLRKRST